MKKWLFNPFVYVAGARSLIIGWFIMLVTAVIAFYGHTHYDGVLDVHVGRSTELPVYFWEQLILWLCAVITFYAAGRIFSHAAPRFIDIAGTFALARWPMICCALAQLALKIPSQVLSPTGGLDSFGAAMIVFAFICIAFSIWMGALMYNAFSVSCNLKGSRAIWVFVVSLLIAEILSKIIFHFLYHHLVNL
jgi:hypothetical protein